MIIAIIDLRPPPLQPRQEILTLSSVRVNRLTSISQVQGQSRHAMRLDEISQQRLREGAVSGTCLAWSKAADSDPRDLLAALKAHKKETGAGERKGAPLVLHALCIVSPEWIQKVGDLHDPNNARNVALFDAAKAWAETWAGKGSVIAARLDLDERGGGIVDVCLSPVRLSRGKPQISTNKPLQELKAATKERNEYAALQTSWASYASLVLDPTIQRGTRKTVTNREHVSPELYGQLKDEARKAAEEEYAARMQRLNWQSDEIVQERHNVLDLRRVLEREREILRKRIEAAKALHEKAREMLASVEALAALIPADLVRSFRTLNRVASRLMKKAGWLNDQSRFTPEAEVTDEERAHLAQAARTIMTSVRLEKAKAELEEVAKEKEDSELDGSGPGGP